MFQKLKSKNKTVATLAVALLICTTALVPMSQVDEAEGAIAPVAILGIGIAIGFGIGFWAGTNLSAPAEGVTDPDVNDNYKALELKNIRSLITTSNGMAGAMIPSDTDMLSFTSPHWNRTIEYSVADSWSLDATYDPNGLLERNLTQTSLSTYLYNWQHALDNSYGQITSQRALWTAYDIYDDCNVSLTHGDVNLRAGDGDRIDFLSAVSHSPGLDKVYLRAVDENGDPFVSSGDKYVYVLGTDAVRLTTAKGLFIDIPPGKHNMASLSLSDGSDLTSGTYTVSGNGILAGAFSAVGKNSADISGAIISESSTVNLVRATDGQLEIIRYDGHAQIVDGLAFGLTYTDRHNATHTVLEDGDGGTTVADVIRAWDGMQKKVADLLERATMAGTVLWDLYDLAETSRDGEGNLVYVSPSSIVPNNEGIELEPQIQVAMAVSALWQAGNYYASNVTALEGLKLDVTLNGASVVCYGDIYSNGILIAQNAVYSPFAYEHDMTLTAGDTVDMMQAGVAIIYGYTDDFDSFLQAPVDSISMLPLASGMSFTTDRIAFEGEDVEEYTLTLNRIVEHTTQIPDPLDPTAPVKLKDISILFVVIALLLASVLALLGYTTRRYTLVIIGVAVAVLGVLTADWSMRVYLGYVGFWDWLPWKGWL